MTTITMRKAREGLDEIVNKVHSDGERVVISRRGKVKAAIVSMRDVKLLQKLEDEIDLKAVAKRRNEPSVKWHRVKKGLGF